VLKVRKIAAATQQQRLIQGAFELPMALLDVAVFVASAGVDRLPLQAVVPQQRLVALRERLPLFAGRQRRRQAVRAMNLRRAAQLPQRVLQAFAEAFQALGKTDAAGLPVGIRQHEVVNQVRKWRSRHSDIQTRAMGEVRGTDPPRLVHLREENFLGRSRHGPPLLDPALQGAELAVRESPRKAPLQVHKQRLGFQTRVQSQLFFELRPDLGERVVARTPRTVHTFDLAGDFAEPPILPCGLGIHAGLGRRLLFGPTVQVEAAKAAHLLIADHPKPP
jgi:hypothetical protein